MSRIFLITLLFAATAFRPAKPTTAPPSGRDIVKKMHDRYAGKWYRSFTFNQTTEVYRNDSLRSTSTWHEFIRFPDRFRMDFGPGHPPDRKRASGLRACPASAATPAIASKISSSAQPPSTTTKD